jgi:hypothetical protein
MHASRSRDLTLSANEQMRQQRTTSWPMLAVMSSAFRRKGLHVSCITRKMRLTRMASTSRANEYSSGISST